MDSPEPEMHAIHLPLTLLKCFNHIKKQSILKEINSAEHEYMNISPPPPPNYQACYGPGTIIIASVCFLPIAILLSLFIAWLKPYNSIYSH